MQGWTHNVSSIELVYRGGISAGSQWQESRCPVASITNGSAAATTDTAAPPCAADFCDAPLCPECCEGSQRCTCAGTGGHTGGLLNKTKLYGGHPVVCPRQLPVCSGYVFNHKWGTCSLPEPGQNGSTTVHIAQPCAYNGNIKIGGTQPLRVPAYVENVYELLGSKKSGHPGEYYLDSAAGFVYYAPHMGETMAGTVGHLPIVE